MGSAVDAWGHSSGEGSGKSSPVTLQLWPSRGTLSDNVGEGGFLKSKRDVISFICKSLGFITFIVRMLHVTIKLPTSFLPLSNEMLASTSNLKTEWYGIPAVIYCYFDCWHTGHLCDNLTFHKAISQDSFSICVTIFVFLVRNFAKMKKSLDS